MNKTRFHLETPDQYQISNFPRFFSACPEDGKPPVWHAEIWPLPALELLSISVTNPALFDPLGDTDAETESAITEALCCGDLSLLPDPRDSSDWQVRQQIIAILAGEVPEWKFVAVNVDSCGASLVIVHRNPQPNGLASFREYLLPTIRSHTFAVRTADGRPHTYLQLATRRTQKITLIHGDITGACEICHVSEPQGHRAVATLDIFQYQR